jgi:hypothetical protein
MIELDVYQPDIIILTSILEGLNSTNHLAAINAAV